MFTHTIKFALDLDLNLIYKNFSFWIDNCITAWSM